MNILGIVIVLVILIFSSILHEIAHGLITEKLGDPTARLMGRITLNPKKHIDPFFSIILPFLMFLSGGIVIGGAKPVPVDPFNLKDGRKDMALVSLAGPMTNIVIAIVASLLAHGLTLFSVSGSSPFATVLQIVYFLLIQIVSLNLLLAIFNLIPIPPLDGSKVFSLLLPESLAATYLSIGNIGIFIVYFLLILPGSGFINLMQNLLNIAGRLLGV